MSAWYREGKVNVSTGSQTVVGVGTKFIANCRVGDGFRGPDGGWYEVINVASETGLAIFPAYVGAAINNGTYMLAPLEGYVKESADRLRVMVEQFGDALIDLTGKTVVLTVAGVAADDTNNVPVAGLKTALGIDNLQPKETGKGLSSNDYTTTEKNKLAGIAAGATANSSDATLVNRANHTGTQLAATISNFAAAVRDTVLTGLATTQLALVLATDSVLVAVGKLQAQITAGGWGLIGGSTADVNAVTVSQKFGINTPATTLNIPLQRGSATPFAAGSTGIVSVWSTAQWQMLMFNRSSNDIVLRRMASGVIQPDDYLVLYPTGKNFLDINQGGTGGATAAAAQTALGLVPVANTGDVTAGRLATVGWMGLGSVATPYLTDLNALTGTRMFTFGTGQTANMIAGMDYGQGLFLNGPSGTDGSMLLLNHDSDRAFMKRKRANVYSAGFEFHTTANSQLDPSLGTGGLVSSTVVSGFRVEKFVNGTMCVTGKVALASQGANTYGYQTLNLPVTFLNTANMVPGLTCNAQSTGDAYGVVFQRAASTSSILYAVRNGATAQAFEVNVQVWGTWK